MGMKTLHTDSSLRYREGYYFRVVETGIKGWLNYHMLTPQTKYFHHGLISTYYPYERGGRGDYLTIESIGKGPTTGRLFEDYIDLGRDVQVFRHSDPVKRSYGRMIVSEASRTGEAPYDYTLCAYLVASTLSKILHFKKPPYRPEDYAYRTDGAFICTELVAEGAERAGTLVSRDLRYVPPNVLPFPSLFERAWQDGTVEMCGWHRKCECGALIHFMGFWRDEDGARHWCNLLKTSPDISLVAPF